MKRIFLPVLLLVFCSSLSAQVRVDVGFAAGTQPYEAPDLDSRFLIGPDVLISRGRLALYYALDHADISSGGSMYASHFGLAYRWRLGETVAIRAGAGPSYVTIEQLGGEPTWNAQVELARRTGRLEWFAKVRSYDYGLEEFRIANASPDGPALLGGVRFTLMD
jgi:hypothetical protein